MTVQYSYKTMVRDESEPLYKFAEIKYGKIVSIQEHWVSIDEFRTFFEADSYFIDITGVKIDGEDPSVGDVIVFDEHGYTIKHYKTTYSFAESKNNVIERLKLIRDQKELDPINYNGHNYDADKNSLMRLDKARQSLEDNGIPSITWTTADNERVDITIDDFKGINTAIAVRSNELHTRYNELKEYINNIEDDKYLPIINIIDWDWDVDCNLDEKLDEIATNTVKE